MIDGTCTTASNISTALTIDDLKRAAERLKQIGEEPIRAYMVKDGFDPERGCFLVMPEALRGMFGPFGAPTYVRFSQLIESPCLIQDPMWEFRRELEECARRAERDSRSK